MVTAAVVVSVIWSLMLGPSKIILTRASSRGGNRLLLRASREPTERLGLFKHAAVHDFSSTRKTDMKMNSYLVSIIDLVNMYVWMEMDSYQRSQWVSRYRGTRTLNIYPNPKSQTRVPESKLYFFQYRPRWLTE